MNELMRTLLNLPEQGTELAREIDTLHYVVIIVTMLGAASVAIACVIFLIRYRDRARPSASPPASPLRDPRRGSLWVIELGVVIALLSLFTGWWVIGFRQYTELRTPPDDAIDVYVVGKQWMWNFAYPSGGSSNAVLYAPVGESVRLLLTSRDVVHSFYVPGFRIKQDAVPGRVTSAWFRAERVGTYQVLCAEYCGAGHSSMLATVEVLSADDYQRALAELPRVDLAAASAADEGTPTLAALGEKVAATKGCLRCHTVDGTPHIGPSFAGLYDAEVPVRAGGVRRADAAYLTESMMDPLAVVHRGYPPSMPSYQGLLSATEAGALVEYIRSLRDRPRHRGQQAPLAAPIDGAAPRVELPVEGSP